MIEQLQRYVAMAGWKQVAALAKVTNNLKDLALVAPARPKITYLRGLGTDAIETSDWITLGVVNILMVGDIDYQSTMDEYLSKKRKYDNQLENWEKNNVKGYYLVL